MERSFENVGRMESFTLKKICSHKECREIFQTFFKGLFVPKLEEYDPVQF